MSRAEKALSSTAAGSLSAAAERTRQTSTVTSAGTAYFIASRSIIAQVLKSGTQNSVVVPG